LNSWVVASGFPAGEIAFDYSDAVTGQQKAIFDPVAVLLNEGDETLALANAAGFRCFTRPPSAMPSAHARAMSETSSSSTGLSIRDMNYA
jgi:hypothetical protein